MAREVGGRDAVPQPGERALPAGLGHGSFSTGGHRMRFDSRGHVHPDGASWGMRCHYHRVLR
ncbi:hypothetical protein UO65_1582 [Actinokineospora spheciospongiae]|uniref:Uncharacterized protein n=1 Tax=Actinokineospora spheciospongiae TaxID=909613 RepID=W7IRX6_9PSEU|nr:hypothetical protein UO65_1582 [Actinokineospora spheciospongiae]